MTTRALIERAHTKGLLRYAPDTLDLTGSSVALDLRRTAFTGTEFGYDPKTDAITYAWRSIDGTEIDPSEFLQELIEAVDG